ncbi:MAG: molybdenum cofactor biosynthesis protein [Alphaproteobacteria bacterium]|nr:molybdenum cofactor biosynthesis protein [Alphaproteobacteria bacterium]
MPIKTGLNFTPLNIALLTVSDTRTLKSDRSGDMLHVLVGESGHRVIKRFLVRDEEAEIVKILGEARDDPEIDVLISTGGTGITARDVTPEAFQLVVEKELLGFGEIFRAESFQKIGTSAIQSRATAGIAGKTIFFVLPGSPEACKDAWHLINEMLDSCFRPCNLAEMLPRM